MGYHGTMRSNIVLLDCGDTLVDEATEIKDHRGAVVEADLIPGAAEMVAELVRRGYRLGLVADGPTATFRNVLGHYGLWDAFEASAISEEVGVEKPDARLFTTALDSLGVKPEDYRFIPMVGNNLERDVVGANQLGLVSVWLSWSPRRRHVPLVPLEVPQHTIATPLGLLPLLDRWSRQDRE